jgi:hypothetical protein
LPEILRHVALDQIPRRTGRAAAIEDVDLDVFARRLRIKKLRLAERHGDQSFVEVDRVEAYFAPTALFRSDVRLTQLTLVRPVVRLARTAPGAFNVSDLLERAQGARVGRPPSGWTLTVDRLQVSGGTVHARDEALVPPAEWEVQDVRGDAERLTTRAGADPGRAAAQARLEGARLDVAAETLRLVPLGAVVTLTLDGFELHRPGERARLEVTSVVSDGSTLDLRGELGPIGSPPFLDLVGELALAPAVAPADVEALQEQTLAARIRAFQDERGWPDGPGALVAYFTARYPGEEPPNTIEEQLVLLRSRERLVSGEGIPPGRIVEHGRAPATAPPPADAVGRVELTVVAGDK